MGVEDIELYDLNYWKYTCGDNTLFIQANLGGLDEAGFTKEEALDIGKQLIKDTGIEKYVQVSVGDEEFYVSVFRGEKIEINLPLDKFAEPIKTLDKTLFFGS